MDYDVFISHASENKDEVARPLAELLQKHGVKVWLDSFELKLGDSLRRSIDHGLAKSRFGIVILSPEFFRKEWPQRELDGLIAREVVTSKVILPVWHNISHNEITKYSPPLADKYGVSTNKGLAYVAEQVLQVIKEIPPDPLLSEPQSFKPSTSVKATFIKRAVIVAAIVAVIGLLSWFVVKLLSSNEGQAGVIERMANSADRKDPCVGVGYSYYGVDVIYNRYCDKPIKNWAEYDFYFNAVASYDLYIKYAAKDPRPVNVSLNGIVVLDNALNETTGGWESEFQREIRQGEVKVLQGKNTLRLDSNYVFPHIEDQTCTYIIV